MNLFWFDKQTQDKMILKKFSPVLKINSRTNVIIKFIASLSLSSMLSKPPADLIISQLTFYLSTFFTFPFYPLDSTSIWNITHLYNNKNHDFDINPLLHHNTQSWWHKSSQLEVGSLLDKRYVRYDNSLVISAFKAVDFEPDIHSTTYKCQASNSLGTIVSRDIVINAGKYWFCVVKTGS